MALIQEQSAGAVQTPTLPNEGIEGMKSLATKELGVIKDGITLNPSDKDSC